MTAFFFTPTVVVAVSFVFYTPEKGRGLEKVPVPFMAPNFRVTLTSYERRCIRRVEAAIQIEESNMKRYRFRLLVVLYFKNLHIFVFKWVSTILGIFRHFMKPRENENQAVCFAPRWIIWPQQLSTTLYNFVLCPHWSAIFANCRKHHLFSFLLVDLCKLVTVCFLFFHSLCCLAISYDANELF